MSYIDRNAFTIIAVQEVSLPNCWSIFKLREVQAAHRILKAIN